MEDQTEDQEENTQTSEFANNNAPYRDLVQQVVWDFAKVSPMFDMLLDINDPEQADDESKLEIIETTLNEVREYARNLIDVSTKEGFRKKLEDRLTQMTQGWDDIIDDFVRFYEGGDEITEPIPKTEKRIKDNVTSKCQDIVKALMSYIWMGKVPKKYSTFQRYCKLQQYDPEVVKIAAWYYSIVDEEAQITELCNLHPKGVLGKVGRVARKLKHNDQQDWENVKFSRRRMRAITKRRRNSNFTSINRTKHEHAINKLYQRPRRYKTR